MGSQYRVASTLPFSSKRLFGGELKENNRTKDYFQNYRQRTAQNFIPSNTDFDPNDTAKAFQSMKTYQLIKYNVMFSLLSIEPLTQTMIKIMKPKTNNPAISN